MRRTRAAVMAVALVAGLVAAAPTAAATTGNTGFVTRQSDRLVLAGKPFRFAGTNNYYLMYASTAMVDDVFARAKAADLSVIRTWGSLDIGNQDGSHSIHHKENGVYFQYWNGTKPVYNDGADGLEHLDYVLWKARQTGVKLLIPFVNNWSAFGGVDQYVRWAGGDHHDDFYTDPVIKGWYKDWISHLLNRVNPLTGIAYKDDPTVMAWELANEPRCKGSGNYPTSPSCATSTLTAWADEMSRHVKSVDSRHLVSVGDEGFYCHPDGSDFTEDCSEGVDTVALARLPAIDLLSLHLYPDHWSKDAAWGTTWLRRHLADGRRIGKPVVLGEFGLQDKTTRNPVYRRWLDTFVLGGGAGFTYWMIAGARDDGMLYPDYDGFTVYCPSPVCRTVTNASAVMRGRLPLFPPVADDDAAVTPYGAAVTVDVTTNDTAYGARVVPDSIDLAPATAGRQADLTVPGGTFTTSSGTVTFTPAAGFNGRATATYTVRDSWRRISDQAEIAVVVRPDPSAAITLFSFEDGVQGWAAGSWQTDAGTVAESDEYAGDGTHSLRVDATGGGWFGAALTEPVDLSTKSTLKLDLTSGAAGTSTSVAFQTGPGHTWCQSAWGYQNPGTTATVKIDLISGLSCTSEDLKDVRGVFAWFSPGTFHLDRVRAE
ncbi:cellulase family glycosylhydrolase [Microtetraspora sp. AC03309]|uniref:cellulase family glycosylhydrolase n=1 Tax=Microtetraspora sp. AC03309 TaxID=2779376 RepID=UPI001E615890|nr:cellulase family glycosylhydrolase [Microtetraspora sp. AC03309]MCC5578508.1 cellulase family glycosylhydrolase [Microtetraspora sp. AC03309]